MTPPRQPGRWGTVVLLMVSLFINYVDRGNLSIAAPLLAPELSLSPAQLGFLLSAFFWTYALCQIGAGWLADRYDAARLYAAGYVLWATATLFTGVSRTFAALFAARLLLGIGESITYRVCSLLIVRHFSERERGRANALIDAGSKAGPALGTLLGGLLMARYGWRFLFIATGLASLLWLVPWGYWAPPRAPRTHGVSGAGPGFRALLGRREVWGTSFGMFCFGYVWYFLLTWLPSYLVSERRFTIEGMAVFGTMPFWICGISSVLFGWTSDRLIARGSSPGRVRKTFVVGGLAGCSLILFAATVESAASAIALLCVTSFAIGLFSSNVWATTQTLAGPQAAGKWTGIQNAVGNLGGVVSPIVTGVVVARTHSFVPAFLAASAVALAGSASYLLSVRDVAPLSWPADDHSKRSISAR